MIKKDYSWTEGLKEVEYRIDNYPTDPMFGDSASEIYAEETIEKTERYLEIEKNREDQIEFDKEYKKIIGATNTYVNFYGKQEYPFNLEPVDHATVMYLFTKYRFGEIEWKYLKILLNNLELGRVMMMKDIITYVLPDIEEE